MKNSRKFILDCSQKYLVVFILSTTFGLNSCVTTKKTTYLQEPKLSEYPTEYTAPENYIIQPNDNLFIRVTTPDPKWSDMFNTLPVGVAGMSVTEQAVDILSYPVHNDGTVDIPFLGSVHLAGITIAEAKKILEGHLADYITDADISVKLVNNYVNILGEVNSPGRYLIYKQHLTIFQALAMAGDMSDYSNRNEVSIIRQSSDGTITKEFDLTDKNIIDTEFYYVMPNDVIYCKPMKGKFFGFNQFPYSEILAMVTSFLLILNYIQ